MSVIWYNSIEDVMISLTDPNTWGATSTVPWISSPKIDGTTSIYNMPEWSGIAWWSTDVTWSSTDYNTVAWSSWNIYLPSGDVLAITAWNTWNMSGVTYIYYDESTWTVVSTSTAQNAVWDWKIMLCAASPSESWKDAQYQAFWTDAQSTFITADNIAANTITANEIASNTITANQISASDITWNNLIWNTISWKTIEWCTIRAYYGSWSSLDEIKMWTDWTLPKIQFKDNNTVVWVINWWSVTSGWNTVNALVIWWSSSRYIGLQGKVICMNYLKIPVGNDLYFS